MMLLFLCICQRVFSSGGVRREPSTISRTDVDRLLILKDRSDILLSLFCFVLASSRSLMAFFLKSPQLTGFNPLLTQSQQYQGRMALMVLWRSFAFCFRVRWWSICSWRCFRNFWSYSASVKTFRCCCEYSEAGVDVLCALWRLQTYFNLVISSCSYPNSFVFSLSTISFILSSSLNSVGSFLFIKHSLYPSIAFSPSLTSLSISSSFNLVRESNCEPGVRVSMVRWLGMRGFRGRREGGTGAEEGDLERGRGGLVDGDRDSLLIIIVELRVRSASKKRKNKIGHKYPMDQGILSNFMVKDKGKNMTDSPSSSPHSAICRYSIYSDFNLFPQCSDFGLKQRVSLRCLLILKWERQLAMPSQSSIRMRYSSGLKDFYNFRVLQISCKDLPLGTSGGGVP